MIDVRNLTKYYGPTRSIEDLTFSVNEGEILGFLGPNGAGKSTTIRILAGLTQPTAGSASIGGFDVQKDHRHVRDLIGYLPEQAPLYNDMTLAGFLRFMGGVKGLSPRDAKREMERTTDLVNLQAERKRLVGNLSKGTRQRAAIAQALMGDPKLLLLDEPTNGLDPSQINDVRQLIESFAGKKTVLLSTHILPEVERLCTRIVIIANGSIAANGTPAELSSAGGDVYILEAEGDLEGIRAICASFAVEGSLTEVESGDGIRLQFSARAPDDPRPALAREIVNAGFELREIRRRETRLEEIFLRAIQSERKVVAV